jgi:hypothetical protein
MAESKLTRNKLRTDLAVLNGTVEDFKRAEGYRRSFLLSLAADRRDVIAAHLLADDPEPFVTNECERMGFEDLSEAINEAIAADRGVILADRRTEAEVEMAAIRDLVRFSRAQASADRIDAIVKLTRENVNNAIAMGVVPKVAEVFAAARLAVDGPKAPNGTAKARRAPSVSK